MSMRNAVDNLTALTLRRVPPRLHGNVWPWPRVDVIEPNTATRGWYETDLRRDDHALEQWGRFYCANNLYARGVLFETFMLDPPAIAHAMMFHKAQPLLRGQEFYPLLPEQCRASASDDDGDIPMFLRNQAD